MKVHFGKKSENQNVEWKESWRDEYLKWVCGFANAQGGTIYIGINDNGEVVGVDNAKKLLEDIPNKIVTHLGIVCDVNLLFDLNRHYLEIVVEPYPNPVNFKGLYFFRSGSTKQELKGATLDRFLLQKHGKTWDRVPVPGVSDKNLDEEAFNIFRRKAIQSKRVDDSIYYDTTKSILEKLDLLEGKYVNRAGVLLFHPRPEKFFTGSFVKIGYFASDNDLRFQDEVRGSLIVQIEQTINLLLTKYLKAEIHYEGFNRIETYPFPVPAFREALLNAIAHKDYNSTAPIQISVYDNKLIIWNEGQLPENWTIDDLYQKHPSRPSNPFVSNTLFRAGYIESWGRGTLNMVDECIKNHLPRPKYQNIFSGLVVEFFKHTSESLKLLGLNESFIKIILFTQNNGSISNSTVQDICKVSKRTASKYLSDLENVFFDKKGTTGKGTFYTLKGT